MDDPQSDSRSLDLIEDIAGRRNLCSTLIQMARWSFFADPALGLPWLDRPVTELTADEQRLRRVRGRVHGHVVAYLALVALVRSNPHLAKDLTDDEFRRCVDAYIDYCPPILAGGEDSSIHRLFVRIAYQQFPFQRPWWENLPSAHSLFTSESAWNGFCLAEAVRETIGVSYDDLLSACLWLYFKFRQFGGAPYPPSRPGSDLPWLSEGKLDRILRALSQTQAQFRATYELHRNADRRLRVYDFNPLFDRPLIRIGHEYYAPLPALLPMWAAKGIVYRMLDRYGNGKFTDALGHTFERFVGDTLTRYGQVHIPEVRVHGSKGVERSADFIITDGERGLIVDCKTRYFSLRARYGDQVAINAEFQRSIVKGLIQDIRTELYIRERRPELACVEGVSQFDYGVVTLDDFYLAKAILRNHPAAQSIPENVQCHIMSGDELALVLANSSGRSLVQLVHDKASDESTAATSFHDHVAEQFWLEDAAAKDPARDFMLNQLERMRRTLVSAGWTE